MGGRRRAARGPADDGWQNREPVSPESPTRLAANAETLVWQWRIRITVACVAAVAELLLLGGGGGGETGSSSLIAAFAMPVVLLASTLYVAITTLIAARARRSERISAWLVNGTVVNDVAFIFVLTVAVSAPAYYDRILILAFLALHLTTFYFGRRYATLVVALTAIGYSALIRFAVTTDAPLSWREEAWSLGAFLLAATVVLLEHGRLRIRLANLVRLFRRAEEGDFSEAYEEADERPDAITRVGVAYNRVRGQLASMVLTDPLTGCVNRRGFDQALAREIARATRAGSDLSLLALDVDHFKSVNDTHGHLAGDAVLREVGALLHHAARAGDIVARTGGEEFALILPDTPASGAYHVATRICESLRAYRFGEAAGGIRLTVSVGVAAMDFSLRRSGDGAEQLKGRADEALYAAKRGGRDRVRVWAQRDEQVELAIQI